MLVQPQASTSIALLTAAVLGAPRPPRRPTVGPDRGISYSGGFPCLVMMRLRDVAHRVLAGREILRVRSPVPNLRVTNPRQGYGRIPSTVLPPLGSRSEGNFGVLWIHRVSRLGPEKICPRRGVARVRRVLFWGLPALPDLSHETYLDKRQGAR